MAKNGRGHHVHEEWYVGELFVGGDSLPIRYPGENEKDFLLNENKGDFHILPKEYQKELCENVKEKRKNIVDELNWIITNNHPELSLKEGTGKKGFISGVDESNYFRFIRIKKGDIPYDLIFNRFYIENKKDESGNYKTVNSILDKLQYSKGEDGFNYLYYPDSPENGAKKGDDKNHYYNPQVSLDDDAKVIADDFITYVTKY